MSDQQLAEACLARAPAFASLDEGGRQRLAAAATRLRVMAGETVLKQGDVSDAFFLLVRGFLRVEAEEIQGVEARVARIDPGQVFGEIGVLGKDTRSASVIAETEADVLRFGRMAAARVLRDYPQVLAELHALGVTRTQDLLEKMLTD